MSSLPGYDERYDRDCQDEEEKTCPHCGRWIMDMQGVCDDCFRRESRAFLDEFERRTGLPF